MPCEMKGSNDVIKAFEKALGITAGSTTEDGKVTLEKTSCIGMCDSAPAIMVNEELIGNVTPAKVKTILQGLK